MEVGPIEVIWSRPERSARGPRPAHSRDAVAAAAVRVADAEGIDAVSMRRVATELGTGTTSLYRYISRKNDLLDLMVDAVLRHDDPPERTGDWRADLRVLARRTRQTMLDHPWLAMLSAARPNLGPGSLRWMEAWLVAVDGLGLDPDEMLVGVTTLQIFISGAVLSEFAQREADHDAETWMAEQGSYGEEIITGGRYPTLARLMIEAKGPHARDHIERGFTLGVERILDGIAATIGR